MSNHHWIFRAGVPKLFHDPTEKVRATHFPIAGFGGVSFVGETIMKSLQKPLVLSMLSALAVSGSADAVPADGVYRATAQGMGGPLEVTVRVESGRMVGVEVDASRETPGYGLEAGPEVAKRIAAAQSTEVDGVSGATVTSRAVKAAAEAAMREAGLLEAKAARTVRPGEYRGRARGGKSDVEALVRVSADGSIEVLDVKTDDTPYLSDTAVREVVRAVTTQKSLSVDAITGATLTSRGVAGAIADALDRAGVDLAAWRRVPPALEKTRGAEVDADVVVVGGGAAGMLAALSAKTDGSLRPDKANNLKVVLLETKGYLGGDLTVCGGYVASYSGTPLNDRTGHSIDGKTVVEATLAMKSPEVAKMLNQDLAARVVDASGPAMAILMQEGWRVMPEDATRGAVLSPWGKDGFLHYTVARTSDPATGYRSGDAGYDTTSGSPAMASTLADIVRRAGVDVRLETSATDVTATKDKVESVEVSDAKQVYRINAKAVVLATGYSGLDPDSIKRFYPSLEGVIRTGGAGVTSFAPKWVADHGGEIALNPASSTMLGYDAVLGIDGPESALYLTMAAPWVNVRGERFMSEAGNPYRYGVGKPDAKGVRSMWIEPGKGRSIGEVLKQPGKRAWMIFDANSPANAQKAHLAAAGLCVEADTLAELARRAGLPEDTFVKTIERYNTDAAAGGDTVFGAPASGMTPVLKAPFIAVRVSAVNTIANAAVHVADDFTVLMGPEGPNARRIEGLFGAGGAIGNAITNSGLGAHNATAIGSGALAGAEAAKYAERN